jgi:hypothetical protein
MARRRATGYLTDGQHGQAEWIESLACEVIIERALSAARLTKSDRQLNPKKGGPTAI